MREQFAGPDRQGFPKVHATFEAIITSRQGLDVGGLQLLNEHIANFPNWSA
jgi:hypothetical protein